MPCVSLAMRTASRLIWVLSFVENLLYLLAFQAGGLRCFFLAAKDRSASIETMAKAQESF